MNNINKYWENIANVNPYWGVMTNEIFNIDNISNTEECFYSSGLDNKLYIFNYLKSINYDVKQILENNILEIGSGVGRIGLHFLKDCNLLYCIDVSEKYMEICKDKFIKNKLFNFEMINYENFYDYKFKNVKLVYTFITLQHNPPQEIIKIVKNICNILDKEGVAFVHIPYNIPNYEYKDLDIMQMNMVKQDLIIDIINNNNCNVLNIDTNIDMCGGGIQNCIYIFKKN